MSHALINGCIAFDRRVINAGNAALGAWVRMLAWSARHRRMGLVDRRVALSIAGGAAALARLEQWEMLAVDGDGFRLLRPGVDWRIPSPGLWSRAAYPEVQQRDGDRCRYCLDESGPFTIDHVIPRCQGGGDGAANLVVACAKCNTKKSGRTPEQAGMTLQPAPEGRRG